MNTELWNIEVEKDFFIKAISEGFATKNDLFYKFNDEYYAYVCKGQQNNGQTLQSRNSLIGEYTETWCTNLLQPIAQKFNLFAIKGVVCPSIGLTKKSAADVAFCTKDSINQEASDIKLIIEVKMSIVNNYKLNKDNELEYIGDYRSHKGNPSLLRSDSMLKAIGKAINIRVSGSESANIPIIIIGISPITMSYIHKVDFLKTAGVIQGMYSLYPNPTSGEYNHQSPKQGFVTIEDIDYFEELLAEIINSPLNYFSSMLSKPRLGEIITRSSRESTEIAKAEKFLELIRG